VLVEAPARRLGEQIDGVEEVFPLGEPAPRLHPARGEEEQYEDDVDHRRGRLEEVVVVGGDELAQLVDEEAEADPADHRRGPPPPAPEKRQQEPDRDQHEQPAPEKVSDVQPPRAELRVVRRPQLQPDDDDHRHRRDQKRVLQRPDLGAANRPEGETR
jgi:phage terminase small subunit